MKWFKNLIPLIVLSLMVGAAAFAVGVVSRDHGQAEPLPGVIDQTSSATGDGFVVTVERAIFTATYVDVQVQARPQQPMEPASEAWPLDAHMNNVPVESVHALPGGHALLRFPVEAWPSGIDKVELAVASLAVPRAAGNSELVKGAWSLTVVLPKGPEADEARKTHALEPVTVVAGGQEVLVSAFHTALTTVMRYELPAGARALAAPTLLAGTTELHPIAIRSPGGINGVSFPATEATNPLTLLLHDLLLPDPNSDAFVLSLRIERFDPPKADPGNEVGPTYVLEYERAPESRGPEVLRLTWQRIRNNDARLRIFVAGLWDPQLGSRPAVTANGVELRLIGVGGTPATADQAAFTIITVELPQSEPLERLDISAGGAAVSIPRTEVVLQR